MRSLLVDLLIVVLVAPSCSAWQRICGEQLVETVSMVCSSRGFYSHRVSKRDAELFQDERVAKSFLGSRIGSRQRRRTGRIATECCERVCSYDIVESYCNPWPVVEDRADPIVQASAAAAGHGGRPRPDKSASAAVAEDEEEAVVYRLAGSKAVEAEEGNSARGGRHHTEGEAALREQPLDSADKTAFAGDGANLMMMGGPQEKGGGDGKEEEEDEEEEEEVRGSPFPLPVPSKKRRRLEGRRSRENSRDRGSKSEGRGRRKSGSREGGRSSRRRGKSSRSKKGRDGRERSKRWEGLITSRPPTKDIIDAIRSAFQAASRNPYRNVLQISNEVPKRPTQGSYPWDEQPATSDVQGPRLASRLDEDASLVALYHLAMRLAKVARN